VARVETVAMEAKPALTVALERPAAKAVQVVQ
jgi:hypothetical protein